MSIDVLSYTHVHTKQTVCVCQTQPHILFGPTVLGSMCVGVLVWLDWSGIRVAG